MRLTPGRVLVSGSTGLIGRHVVAALRLQGHTVVPLTRGSSATDGIRWNPGVGSLSPQAVSGFDTVIHLAGEPVLGLWTAAKKRRILQSRAIGTRVLATALAAAPQPPRLFLSASGINVYGHRGDQLIDEVTPSGTGFLPEVCRAWEAATAPLDRLTRVVHMRIGVVLSASGGTLGLMLPIFRLGLGGTIGSGRNYISWISLNDLFRAMQHLMAHDALSGPVNLVSPNPVTSRDFSRELASAVHRPAFLRVPAWAARLALGGLAQETLLSSVRALPTRLLANGFTFAEPTLPEAFAALGIARRP